MAIDQQVATTLLRYQVDTQSISTAIQANERISSSYEDISIAAASVGLSADEFITRTSVQVSSADQIAEAQLKVADAYDQVAASAADAATAQDGANSGGPSLRSVGRAFSVLGGGKGISQLGQAAFLEESLGPAGVGIGLLAVGLKALETETQRETQLITAEIDARQKASQVIATSTREALTGARDAAVQQLQQQQAELDKISKTPVQINANSILGLLTQGTLGGGEQQGVSQSVEKQQVLIAQTKITIDEYNSALAQNLTITNDQVDAVTRLLNADKLTTEQRNTRAEQDRRDINLINEQIQSGKLGEDATFQLSQKQAQLYADYQDLTGISSTYADQLLTIQTNTKTISDQITSYNSLLTQEVGLNQDIFDTQTKITQARGDATAKETDLLTTETANIANIEQQGADKRAEIIQSGLDDAARITRDGLRAEGTAIKSRSAVDFDQAKTQLSDKLTDEQKAQTKSLAQEQVAENKQLASEKTSLDKSTRQIETALSQQTSTLQQHLRQDQTNLVNVTSAEISVAINGSSNLYHIHQSMWADLGALAGEGFNNLIQQAAIFVQATAGIITGPYNPYTFGLPGASGYQPMTPAKVRTIVRETVGGYIGINNPGGNSLR